LEEKTKIKEEMSELYRERRKQQIRIRLIEQKLHMVEEVSQDTLISFYDNSKNKRFKFSFEAGKLVQTAEPIQELHKNPNKAAHLLLAKSHGTKDRETSCRLSGNKRE
jgi:hypothetical protein